MAERLKKTDSRFSPLKNFLSGNPLFSLGLAVSPAVLYVDTVQNGITLAVFITALSLLTLTVSSFIPRRIVYTSRVILYTLFGSLMFVPLNIIFGKYFPERTASMGIIAPLLITNPFIVSLSELRFFREKKSRMFADIITVLLGYSFSVIIFGFIRELISSGGINGRLYGTGLTVSAFGMPFGGLILLGLMSAAVRRLFPRRKDG